MKMKILVPVNNPREIEPLVKEGADEFYCGVLSEEWKSKYTNMASINRREFQQSNLSNFKSLQQLVDKAHSFGKPVLLALNAFYTDSQYHLILKEYKKSKKIGIDGFIIADIGLLNEIRKRDKKSKIIISTGATVFNSESAKFYGELGANRITLPRHLTTNEIKDIVKKCKNINFDIFIMNTRCMNIDGFCTYQHGINEVKSRFLAKILKSIRLDSFLSKNYNKFPWIINKVSPVLLGSTSACCLNYMVLSNNRSNSKTKKVSCFFGPRNLLNHCGACSLYELDKLNIESVKIIGREFPLSKKIKDVRFIRTCLNYLKKKPSKTDYYKYCIKQYKQIYTTGCNKLCYYIE